MQLTPRKPFRQTDFESLIPEPINPLEHPEKIRAMLSRATVDIFGDEIRDSLSMFTEGADPFYHLKGAFDCPALPDTPKEFIPKGDTSWYKGAYTALALLDLADLQHVSYQCENSGSLFVNLVALPGEGRLAEKSTKDMRGHTDACSFPLPNEEDKTGKLSSSPDFVVLIGLRNPNNVPTCVASLAAILPIISEPALTELQKDQFLVGSQATFEIKHQALDVPVISIHPQFGYQIRFSHGRVSVPEENTDGKKALEELKAAVEKSLQDIIILPGDLLVINNRTALHGRRKVGGGVGGGNRWIQRTYANRKTTPSFPVDKNIPFRLQP